MICIVSYLVDHYNDKKASSTRSYFLNLQDQMSMLLFEISLIILGEYYNECVFFYNQNSQIHGVIYETI